MKPYCSSDFSRLLDVAGLNSFDALWQLDLEAVDTPNCDRGGLSRVCRLELPDEQGLVSSFYIKLQSNHLSRSWQRPFGEPTFAREYRNILAYESQGVPALKAAYYQERKHDGVWQAILVTRALDQYTPLSDVVALWSTTLGKQKRATLKTVAQLIARLHNARLTHHCLYPKHVYINCALEPQACLIDLEKTRYQLLRKRDTVADLAALLRRWTDLDDSERFVFLEYYLAVSDLDMSVDVLMQAFFLRKKDKESRA